MNAHTVTAEMLAPINGASYNGIRLYVAGSNNSSGWGIGLIPTGSEGRKECGGPMVPGPWGFAYGLAGIIDNRGGSKRLREEAEAAGLVIVAEFGDVLDFGTEGRHEIINVRGYVELRRVDA